jgi:hypothetical protein
MKLERDDSTGVLQADSFDLGWNIGEACEKAVAIARQENSPVHFLFNGIDVTAYASSDANELANKYMSDTEVRHEAYINSDEYKELRKRDAEDLSRKMAAPMKESAQTEAEMRAAKAPTPYTSSQLTEYVESLVKRTHDYGTCVHAMSLAATATFNYVAHQLGVTGFQASCADLDILRQTRHIDGPFILLKGQDALFPQYDLRGKLNDALKEWKPWLKEQAAKKLTESGSAHPDVVSHWKMLAKDGYD